MGDRFRLVSSQTAEKMFPGAEYYDRCVVLVEFVDNAPVRILASDGGEPEDATFGRDWRWVVDELNSLAIEVKD